MLLTGPDRTVAFLGILCLCHAHRHLLYKKSATMKKAKELASVDHKRAGKKMVFWGLAKFRHTHRDMD